MKIKMLFCWESIYNDSRIIASKNRFWIYLLLWPQKRKLAFSLLNCKIFGFCFHEFSIRETIFVYFPTISPGSWDEDNEPCTSIAREREQLYYYLAVLSSRSIIVYLNDNLLQPTEFFVIEWFVIKW